MNDGGRRAWIILQLDGDYRALGESALENDFDECRFLSMKILDLATRESIPAVVTACSRVKECLDPLRAYPLLGLGQAFLDLGGAIAQFAGTPQS